MSICANDYLESFPQLLTHISGDLNIKTLGPSSPQGREQSKTYFVGSDNALQACMGSSPAIVISHTKASEACTNAFPEACVLATGNVPLAIALTNKKFFPITINKKPFLQDQAIHPSAVIHPTAQLGEQVVVGPNAVIAENVQIGDFTYIGGNTYIEPNVSIGQHSHIYPCVFIGLGSEIGNHCEVQSNTSLGTPGYGYAQNEKNEHFPLPHYGKVIIEDNVQIGANNNFDRGTFDDTVIGQGTKIDNHCHFPHNFSIGKNSLVTAGFIAAGSTHIGANFVCGGRTSLGGHLSICDNVQLAALSTVTKDITEPGNYAGYPLAKHRDAIRYQSVLPSLPEMRKTLNKIKKTLNI